MVLEGVGFVVVMVGSGMVGQTLSCAWLMCVVVCGVTEFNFLVFGFVWVWVCLVVLVHLVDHDIDGRIVGRPFLENRFIDRPRSTG